MFNFANEEEAESEFAYFVVTKDGEITGYFNPHEHATIDMDDLESLEEASLTNVAGAIVKACAEKVKEGSSEGITEEIIRDKFQADNNARMEALREAEEIEK